MKNKTQYNCAKLRFSLNKGRTLWNRPMLGLVWFDIPDWPDLMGLFCFLETVTHCQDHILKGYIWFVWSSTPYSGDKWECYLCETNHQRTREDRATKPVVCQKAEFCNCIFAFLTFGIENRNGKLFSQLSRTGMGLKHCIPTFQLEFPLTPDLQQITASSQKIITLKRSHDITMYW